jgi:hypothetical protein
MRSSSKLRWVRFNFRVNDLEFKEALLRSCGEDPADYQLVVEHRFLGAFALHEDFVLEVRGFDGSATWRRVKLEELKLAFLEASRNDGGVTEKEWDRWEVSGLDAGANHANLPRMPVEGDSSHIVRATEAFLRGGVRYKIVGGIGSRGQVWGHATFVVCSLPGARMHLLCAGFLPSSDSEYVLISSKNGWKIRLLEKRAKSDQENECHS